jgi:hypothetical protein
VHGVEPGDDDLVPITEALTWQIEIGQRRAAPIATEMLLALRDDAPTGLLPEFVRFGDLVGLRLLAFLHRMALERKAPALALWCPTLGGRDPFTDAARGVPDLRQAVIETTLANPVELARAIGQVPQTNETGRARMLRCVLSRLPRKQPVRLVELACSAGLNLRADHLPGDPALEAGPMPSVVERIGCDLNPIDPSTTEGRLLLTSYIWVDHVDRFERLRHALDVAGRIPANVVRADAADFVEALEPAPGVITVLWHSAMWMYMDGATQGRVVAGMERLGTLGTSTSPVVITGYEFDNVGDGSDFDLTVRAWGVTLAGFEDLPVGDERVVARGSSHGVPARLA